MKNLKKIDGLLSICCAMLVTSCVGNGGGINNTPTNSANNSVNYSSKSSIDSNNSEEVKHSKAKDIFSSYTYFFYINNTDSVNSLQVTINNNGLSSTKGEFLPTSGVTITNNGYTALIPPGDAAEVYAYQHQGNDDWRPTITYNFIQNGNTVANITQQFDGEETCGFVTKQVTNGNDGNSYFVTGGVPSSGPNFPDSAGQALAADLGLSGAAAIALATTIDTITDILNQDYNFNFSPPGYNGQYASIAYAGKVPS